MKKIIFGLDFEKEERILNDMCADGYAMTDVKKCIYSFIPCSSGEFIYRIAYLHTMGPHEFLRWQNQLSDKGIEFVGKTSNKAFFRSRKAFEFYSDTGIKKHVYTKIRNVSAVYGAISFIAAFMFILLTIFFNLWWIIVTVIGAIIAVKYISAALLYQGKLTAMNVEESGNMPMYGVGPVYVGIILFITVAGVVLSAARYIPIVNMGIFRIPCGAIGAILIASGPILWWKAVFGDKVDDHIKNGTLATTGVYAWVRNPIYSAFLMLCAGVLMLCNNLCLLILPLLFWLFLTVLMKHTEEKWLEKAFGYEYKKYCKKANRCIPWFPKSN